MNWKQTEFVHRCPILTAWDIELFYSNMYPPNTTVNYIDTDPETEDTTIQYKFNEYGFRSEPFFKRSELNILTIGCSLTVGVGVNENWTEKLKYKIQDHTSKTVTTWNLATSGASSDYVVRSFRKVFEILIPDLIFIYWPPCSRLELPDPNNDRKISQILIDNTFFPKLLVNNYYLESNLIKNKFVSRRIVPNHNKRKFENKEDIYFDNYSRDGQHPDEEWHERVAEMFFQQYLTK